MTLPASPPITLSQILAEFGAPANTPLASMLRGGAYVPDIPQNAGVPTALPINMLDFLGATDQPPVVINNQTISISEWFEPDGVPPLAAEPQAGGGSWNAGSGTYILRAAGNSEGWFTTGAQNGSSSMVNFPGEWKISGASSAYEVRFTLLSGGAGGTFGQWLNLGSDRSCSLVHFGVGVHVSTVQVEIRTAGGAVLDTCVITFECSRDA